MLLPLQGESWGLATIPRASLRSALGYEQVAPSLSLQRISEPIGELTNVSQFFPTFVVRRKD